MWDQLFISRIEFPYPFYLKHFTFFLLHENLRNISKNLIDTFFFKCKTGSNIERHLREQTSSVICTSHLPRWERDSSSSFLLWAEQWNFSVKEKWNYLLLYTLKKVVYYSRLREFVTLWNYYAHCHLSEIPIDLISSVCFALIIQKPFYSCS